MITPGKESKNIEEKAKLMRRETALLMEGNLRNLVNKVNKWQ